jgi:general L-amino acid transport system substrate-binding protein
MMKLVCTAAMTAWVVASSVAYAGPVLDRVRAQNNLKCGIGGSIPTFSRLDSSGNWVGLDVDYCRAVAAAVLGDAKRVTFVPLSLQQRFIALQSGDVDILARDSVMNLSRDTSLGIVFVGVNFHTGAGFIVRRDAKVQSTDQMNGATFCISQGNSALADLTDHMKQKGFKLELVQHERFQETFQAFLAGRCDAAIAGAADLAGAQAMLVNNAKDYVVLEQLLSYDPYGPAVARGDWEWFSITRWVLYGLIQAEERSISQANVRQLAASATDPAVRRILGLEDNLGGHLGLPRDWMVKVIEAVGNYGEIYDQHFGTRSPVNMPRGRNNLVVKGGLMVSPPFR